MASVAESQLGELRECFDCEDGSPSGHRQAGSIVSKQQKRSAMNVTMAFVLGYLIGVMDFDFILKGLGLGPMIKQHGASLPNVISFDLDCIGSRRKAMHRSFEDCELADPGDKATSSQDSSQKEKDLAWVLQSMSHFAFVPMPGAAHPVSAASRSETRPQGVAMLSAGSEAMTPMESDSNSVAKAYGEGGVMSMPPGAMASSVDDGKDAENAAKTRRKPLKAVLSGAVAAATLFIPTASKAEPAQAAATMVDFSKEGISIFNNMRTPAALVAAVCLQLFVASTPTSGTDTRRTRMWKRANVITGFLSITSQLLCVIFATQAINRLTEHAGTAETMATGLEQLLTKDLFVQFWLGTYIHFILGIIGMLVMLALRAWFLIPGAGYTPGVTAASMAIGFRVLSVINRGVVVREFGRGPGGSNFFYLIIHYLKITMASASKLVRIADLASAVCAIAAIGILGTTMVRSSTINEDTSSEEK